MNATEKKVIFHLLRSDQIKPLIELNGCIRNTTAVCNPRQNLRQNSVRDKILPETKSSLRQNSVQEKI